MPIINSLLDNDFYTFTQMQIVLHQFSLVETRYVFKWRNFKDMKFSITQEEFLEKLNKELDSFCELTFKGDELEYLSKVPYFKKDFINFLRLFKLDRKCINTGASDKGELYINFSGIWLYRILLEVPILAIVSQLYTENNTYKSCEESIAEARVRLADKLTTLENVLTDEEQFMFADFGTRRRCHVDFHDEIVRTILSRDSRRFFIGTSNVLLAMRYNVKPIGTMSHQFLQMHQQLGGRLIDSQKNALQAWANEYRGELGIALSDVIGFDAFLKDFDRYFALLFDGCRHDSGDPFDWCNKLIAHYKGLRIEPKTKFAVFSDGLNFMLAIELYRVFHKQINTSFGIGTYLTNDCGFPAPQIVIKVVECNGEPVAKISDSQGKGMCEDPEFENYLRSVVKRKLEL